MNKVLLSLIATAFTASFAHANVEKAEEVTTDAQKQEIKEEGSAEKMGEEEGKEDAAK